MEHVHHKQESYTFLTFTTLCTVACDFNQYEGVLDLVPWLLKK